MKVVDIGIKRQSTLPHVFLGVVDVGQVLQDTLSLVIAEYMLIEVDICHNRPSTLPPAISNRFGVECRGGYRSHTNHYVSHNQGESGSLLNFSRDTIGGGGRVSLFLPNRIQ